MQEPVENRYTLHAVVRHAVIKRTTLDPERVSAPHSTRVRGGVLLGTRKALIPSIPSYSQVRRLATAITIPVTKRAKQENSRTSVRITGMRAPPFPSVQG